MWLWGLLCIYKLFYTNVLELPAQASDPEADCEQLLLILQSRLEPEKPKTE